MAFTAVEQKAHRLALARHLSRNVKDRHYDHRRFDKCALGRAAKLGIGGLYMLNGTPTVGKYSSLYYGHDAGEYVFGERTCMEIFAGWNDHSRKDVIKALREYVD